MNDLFSKQATALYKGVWDMIQKGEEPSGGAAIIAAVMKEHPEFNPFWEAGETAFYPHEIQGFVVNPLVHTGLHVIIEKQLLEENPAEVGLALGHLIEKGTTRHEALHRIAALWGDLYFRSVRQGNPFDDGAYLQELMSLAQDQ